MEKYLYSIVDMANNNPSQLSKWMNNYGAQGIRTVMVRELTKTIEPSPTSAVTMGMSVSYFQLILEQKVQETEQKTENSEQKP
jgi:hypothetical protein